MDKTQYTQTVSIVAAILEVRNVTRYGKLAGEREDTTQLHASEALMTEAKGIVDYVWQKLDPPSVETPAATQEKASSGGTPQIMTSAGA